MRFCPLPLICPQCEPSEHDPSTCRRCFRLKTPCAPLGPRQKRRQKTSFDDAAFSIAMLSDEMPKKPVSRFGVGGAREVTQSSEDEDDEGSNTFDAAHMFLPAALPYAQHPSFTFTSRSGMPYVPSFVHQAMPLVASADEPNHRQEVFKETRPPSCRVAAVPEPVWIDVPEGQFLDLFELFP